MDPVNGKVPTRVFYQYMYTKKKLEFPIEDDRGKPTRFYKQKKIKDI